MMKTIIAATSPRKKSHASLDTLQVKDYSQFAMGAFDEAAKKERHDKQFPVDLAECFKMGTELNK